MHLQGSSTMQAKRGSIEKNFTLIKTPFSCSLVFNKPPKITLRVLCSKHKDSDNGTADAQELGSPSPPPIQMLTPFSLRDKPSPITGG